MRDPRAGASLPTLQLPDRGAWRGSRWTNLLLRSLRAYRWQNNIEGSSLDTASCSRRQRWPQNTARVGGWGRSRPATSVAEPASTIPATAVDGRYHGLLKTIAL